jgi:hypothetical protein
MNRGNGIKKRVKVLVLESQVFVSDIHFQEFGSIFSVQHSDHNKQQQNLVITRGLLHLMQQGLGCTHNKNLRRQILSRCKTCATDLSFQSLTANAGLTRTVKLQILQTWTYRFSCMVATVSHHIQLEIMI